MSTTTEHLQDVESMYVDSVGVQPVDKDWSEGYPEGWDVVRVPVCPSCETVCPDDDIEVTVTRARAVEIDPSIDPEGDDVELEVERDCCPNPDCEHFQQEVDPLESGDEPMMNYYYPLPSKSWGGREGWDRSDAAKLAGVPLCIVYFDGDPSTGALALTGGGMDLSWEICEAFMRLGFLPPAHFAELPGMAGYPRGDVHRWVIAGCRRTFEVQASQALRGLEHLQRLESD